MRITIPENTQEKKEKRTDNLFTRDFSFGSRRRTTDKIKTQLYSDLHLLFSSGLNMNTVFEILIDQTVQAKTKQKFEAAHEHIIKGRSLAEALREEQFAGDYEYYALNIGEESGKLEEVLSEIKKYYERKQKQRRQLSGALTYPMLVVVTAVVAVGFMLNVIVPMFEEVFQRFQGTLPALTQKIIDLSDWMSKYGWIILIAIFLGVLGSRKLVKSFRIKRFFQKMLLKIPVFGSLVKNIESARFCHIMTLLTSAHSPLVQSLKMIGNMINFLPLKDAIHQAEKSVIEGTSLHQSLAASDFFDRKFTSLIKAAEEINQLDYAFGKLNDQYNEEIDHKLSILEKLLEPFLIILVGGMVAVILIAMYLPLFQIGTTIY